MAASLLSWTSLRQSAKGWPCARPYFPELTHHNNSWSPKLPTIYTQIIASKGRCPSTLPQYLREADLQAGVWGDV